MMRSTEVYIGVGANLDDPRRHVEQAIAELSQLEHCADALASPIYQSEPLGPPGQPDYFNAVVKINTSLSAEALLDALQAIESAHGRKRDGERWGPRTLDLDILLYGHECIATTRLKVPHPEISQRNFVLQPLLDLAPSLEIPGQGRLRDLIEKIPLTGLKKSL
jgi:2-amino-4-hydroxy-6-hydroxymethyldihydropteridine diphosphokinase